MYAWSDTGTAWDFVKTVCHERLIYVRGMRFSVDGALICVVSVLSDSLRFFGAKEGELVYECPARSYNLVDVEVAVGGWIVLGISGKLTFVSMGKGRKSRILANDVWGDALALVPGLGIAVRCRDDIVFYATENMAAMRRMAPMRVAWMVAVFRGVWGNNV